jgi:hypothetical protein
MGAQMKRKDAKSGFGEQWSQFPAFPKRMFNYLQNNLQGQVIDSTKADNKKGKI